MEALTHVMLALSFDMGGTHIGCGIVDDHKLLAQAAISSEGGHSLAALLPAVATTVGSLLSEMGIAAQECSGLAVGFPGIVNVRDNTIHSTLKKYEDAPQLDLAKWSYDTLAFRSLKTTPAWPPRERFAGAE